jgi:hypothetical protein
MEEQKLISLFHLVGSAYQTVGHDGRLENHKKPIECDLAHIQTNPFRIIQRRHFLIKTPRTMLNLEEEIAYGISEYELEEYGIDWAQSILIIKEFLEKTKCIMGISLFSSKLFLKWADENLSLLGSDFFSNHEWHEITPIFEAFDLEEEHFGKTLPEWMNDFLYVMKDRWERFGSVWNEQNNDETVEEETKRIECAVTWKKETGK